MLFIDLTDANTYFTTRLNTEAWDGATDDEKTAGLTMATKAMDTLNYLGDMADEDQELQFPRGDDSTVPVSIQEACAEEAMALLDGRDPELEFENLDMKAQGYSNVRSTYNRESPSENILAGIMSVIAWRLIKPYLRDNLSVELHRVS